VKILRYIELKSSHSDNGPAWIAYVKQSKTGRTLYFNGRGLMKLKGQRRGESGGNYIDMENHAMPETLTLVSHRLCPYVQRAVISPLAMTTGL